ncbi:MAG: adenylosuccinate synthetase [Gammaproteobacteria bacterium]|nr:adenylosuccinate synthetase [Gammaproteobacteria bacterium]
MRDIVVISGRTCTGKSSLAHSLNKEFGFEVVKSRDVLRMAGGQALDRTGLQLFGDEQDRRSDCKWLSDHVEALDAARPREIPFVVDNIRNLQQLLWFRTNRRWRVVHVHLYAKTTTLESRFAAKNHSCVCEDPGAYKSADLIKNESDIEAFKRDADVRIWTTRSDPDDTLVRVAARLGLYASPHFRCVDVVVGGQYGSEGKGHIAAYLAKEYDVLMRVGGPNAGHSVSSESGLYTYHQLPSGAKDTTAQLLLGAGMTIRVPELLKEIADCGIATERLCIDPQAMVIEDKDVAEEAGLVSSIASTGRGGGAAAARRIMGRRVGGVTLARDVDALRPYLGSTLERLEEAYRNGKRVLLEGTQGSGLSIFHGPYPYVTSRDTNVAGCLAEAGISPTRVRKVLLVIRSTPIRVGNPDAGGSSGPLKYETTFAEVAKDAGIDPEETTTFERTSTTKRPRRVGWFDWELFRRSCAINAPTDIVLTFADYLNGDNRKARRFEQLDQETIKFIEELECVARAPVSLINTRFPRNDGERLDLRTVIDRRHWPSQRVHG